MKQNIIFILDKCKITVDKNKLRKSNVFSALPYPSHVEKSE